MADPTTPPHDTQHTPKAKELLAERDKEIASLRSMLDARERDFEAVKKAAEDARSELAEIRNAAKRTVELAIARTNEREKAIANKEAPRLIGTINVYLQDNPQDIVDRARPLFEGRVPVDRATKFKIDGRLTCQKTWPLFKRLGAAPKVGETFGVEEMPAEEIAGYAAQHVIVPIA